MTAAEACGTDDYWSWSSLREIDTAGGASKGSAFRAFKQLLPSLTEGIDFIVLDHRTQDGLSARWHAANRLYRSSINPVLLSPQVAERVATAMRSAPH